MVGEDRYYRFVGSSCSAAPKLVFMHPVRRASISIGARPDTYICMCAAYAYVFLDLRVTTLVYIPNTYIPVYIYVIRVRTQFYTLEYSLLIIVIIVITLPYIVGSGDNDTWLLMATARDYVVLIAMNVTNIMQRLSVPLCNSIIKTSFDHRAITGTFYEESCLMFELQIARINLFTSLSLFFPLTSLCKLEYTSHLTT